MIPIRYVKGDATQPQSIDPIVIAHVCNNVGMWGKGFSACMGRAFPESEISFRELSDKVGKPILGHVQMGVIKDRWWFANMFAMDGVRSEQNRVPLRNFALETCLMNLAVLWKGLPCLTTIHMPRIGSGLAGGNWRDIEAMISRQLSSKNIQVTIYDL